MRRPPLALTSGIAWIGVVAGHLTAYLLTYPLQGARHVHLEVTGHSWMGAAVASALAAAPVVLFAAASRAVRSERSSAGLGLAISLASIQVPAFLLLETAERGWSLESAIADPAVLVGLAIQPAIAGLAALSLRLLHRVVRTIVERFVRTASRAERPVDAPRLDAVPPRWWLFLPARRRAPPPLLRI